MQPGKFLKQTRSLAQRGFTLIELIVVVAIIGVLIAIIAPTTAGSKNSAQANQMVKTARAMADNWKMIAQSCGTTLATATTPVKVPTTGSAEQVLFRGTVDSGYTTCYQSSGAARIDGVVLDGSAYKLANLAVTVSQTGTGPIQVAYANVPEDIALAIVKRYSTISTLAVAGGGGTSDAFIYTGPSSGVVATLTLNFPI